MVGRRRWPIDISMAIRPGMVAFPGDPPIRVRRWNPSAERPTYLLSEIHLGSHAGTHLDPPRHFYARAPGADRLDLGALNGICEVVRLPGSADEVTGETVRALTRRVKRVLFRTRNSDNRLRRAKFDPTYVALNESAASELARRGIQLVGLDALSIEHGEKEGFPVHRRLLSAGIAILEGLELSGAPAGRYRLECLPLKIVDGDGAPARAVLWPSRSA